MERRNGNLVRSCRSLFRTYDLGFVPVDVKHLPKLHAGGGEFRKRYLFVAIDRRSRTVHLAVRTTTPSANGK